MKPLIKARAWIKNLVRYIVMALSLHLIFFVVYYSFFYWYLATEKIANFQVRFLSPICRTFGGHIQTQYILGFQMIPEPDSHLLALLNRDI